MGVLIDINTALGNNSWANQAIQERWEEVYINAAFRESKIVDIYRYAQSAEVALASDLGGYIILPVPTMISRVSANLLFGEAPLITPANGDSEKDRKRLKEIIRHNRLPSKLKAAAMSTSSDGGVYWKATVDPSTPRGQKVPILQFIPEQHVIPVFVNGDEMIGATVVTQWQVNNQRYRHLEIHTPGLIRNELWKGTAAGLGDRVALTAQTDTEDLDEEIPYGDIYGFTDLLIGYIPNSISLGSPFGVSDYQGLIRMFLSINELFTTGQDVYRALLPVIRASDKFRKQRNNMPPGVKILWESELDSTMGEASGGGYSVEQGQFLAENHKAYQLHMIDMALMASGTSPQMLGRNVDGGAISGTAQKLKMAHSLIESSGKGLLFVQELEQAVRVLTMLDRVTVGEGENIKKAHDWDDADGLPTIELQDGLPNDDLEAAQIVQTKNGMEAISLEERVRQLNRHQDEEWVQAEVERILDDQARADGEMSSIVNGAIGVPTAGGPLGLRDAINRLR